MRDIAPVDRAPANLPHPHLPDNFLWNTLHHADVTRNLQHMTGVNRETAFAVYGPYDGISVSSLHNPHDRGVAHGYAARPLITEDTARVLGGVFNRDGRVAFPRFRSDVLLLAHSHAPVKGRRTAEKPVVTSLIKPCGADMALFGEVDQGSAGHVSALIASDRKTAKMLLIAATAGRDQHPEQAEHYVSERPQKTESILSALTRCGYSSLMIDVVDGAVPTRYESEVQDFNQQIKIKTI